jgi:hypothetical protein
VLWRGGCKLLILSGRKLKILVIRKAVNVQNLVDERDSPSHLTACPGSRQLSLMFRRSPSFFGGSRP